MFQKGKRPPLMRGSLSYSGFFERFSLQRKSFLDCFMECSADDVCLLFRRKFNEVNCIAGHTDRKLRIILRMLLRIKQRIPVQNIDI